MTDTTAQDSDESTILLARRILSSASRLDLPALKIQLKEDSTGANVRDPSTGTTPLHAAITSGTHENEDQLVKVIELLLENGAIWNDLNMENDTPGCVAKKRGLEKAYEAMVEAGVRAELLFGRLAEMGFGNDAEEEEHIGPVEEKIEEEDDVSRDNHAYLKSELRFRDGILLDSSDNA